VTWSHSANCRVSYSSVIGIEIELQGETWLGIGLAPEGCDPRVYPGDLRDRSCRSRTAHLLSTISPIPRETPLECRRSCGAMSGA
jgi:hypothetical protein